ncbi:MAG: tetratricopeptide repeat protein [Bacteroidetes bacterium]|nr:tetratricopeptide repeat protein [Bacteroidota bacterium]
MRTLLFVFTLFLSSLLFAQDNSTELLAIQYYQNNDFEKASILFEELFEGDPGSEIFYHYYLDCLINLTEFNVAEKMIKKQIKRFPNKNILAVDLGYVYSLMGDERKKKKQYAEVVENVNANPTAVSMLANAFIQRKEFEYAISVFQKGRKLSNDPTAFAFSLAELYKLTGNKELIVDEYINLLYNDERLIQSVQNKLQDEVLDDDFYNLTKQRLIKEVQNSNYTPVFVNLLSWLYIQKKDFQAAFRQQKALDKRSGNNNAALVSLADICISSNAFDIAESIYQYIMEKGTTTPYYFHSKFGLIEVKYLKITSLPNPAVSALIDIEAHYTRYLNTDFFRYIDISEKVILRLAEIKAIYLNKVSDAIELLNKYIDYPRISKTSQAKMKLSLADYYVLSGDDWESSLLYMQVAKMYKDHPLGHEAKFRNAKLSFYRGDFNWANDQLDVLKASTSELIANDALRLAMLIQDVLGFDSNVVPLKMYARADFFIYKHQYDSASSVLDSLQNHYPNHVLIDEVYFLKGQIAEKIGNYNSAIDYYKKVFSDYPTDLLADLSLYSAALIYENQLADIENAIILYERIILEYPESVFVVDSRKKYRAHKAMTKEDKFYQDPPIKP